MTISLNSIDCPHLTEECRQILSETYSIATSNDFLLWSCQSSRENIEHLSHKTIQCIQACIIAHTAKLSPRELITERWTYRVDYPLFDEENFFATHRHVIIFYECFNQSQWNTLFHYFLIRLIVNNPSRKIHYFNTNITLIDMNMLSDYFQEATMNFHHSFDWENFEKQLLSLENDSQRFDLVLIDDFFALIKPYLHLERRIKQYILQLIYRLNRLAQQRSMLILTGLIFPWKKPTTAVDDESVLPADKYLRFQALNSTNEKEIHVRMIDERTIEKQALLNLVHWKNIPIAK